MESYTQLFEETLEVLDKNRIWVLSTSHNKKEKSIRKLAYIFIILCLLPLIACTSKEEKEKEKNNEKLAKPIAQEYLNLNYGGGEIISLDCLRQPRKELVIPIYSDHASSYVKSSVIVNNKEFSIITNVETGQCYDNFNDQLVRDNFKKHAVSALSIDVPYDIEVHYYQKDLIGELEKKYYANFTEYGVSSLEDLYEKDQYEVYVVCKYIASDMDFESIDAKNFFAKSDISDVYLALINFRSKDRYITDEFTSQDYFYFDSPKHYYSLCDVVIASRYKELDIGTGELVYVEDVNYSYAHYASKNINGIEFTWNDYDYNLDFEVVPAEKEIQTEDYSGVTFYSTKDKAILISCTPHLEDTYNINNSIYCFFDKELDNSEMLITKIYEKGINYQRWTIESKKDSYQSLSISDTSALFTLGFYESKK